MGHDVMWKTYSTKINRKTIETEINNLVSRICWEEGASGLVSPIRWFDEVYDTYDEAVAAVERRCTHDYDEIAVKYYERPSDYQPTQAYLNLKERLTVARKRLGELNGFHFESIKAEYIGCSNCGSKIARKYLKSNCCPVCHTDMRPVSTLEACNKAKEKVQQFEKQLVEADKKEAQRYKKRAKIMWLVRVEYHT